MILLKSLIKESHVLYKRSHTPINEEQDIDAEKQKYIKDQILRYQMAINSEYKKMMVNLATLSTKIARKANAATPFKAKGLQADLNDEQLSRMLADSLRSIDSRQFNQNHNAPNPKFITIPIDQDSSLVGGTSGGLHREHSNTGMFSPNFVFKILLTPDSEGNYDVDIDYTKQIPEMRSFTVSILDLYKHMNEVTLKFAQAAKTVEDNIDLTRSQKKNTNQAVQNNNQQNKNDSSTHGDISKDPEKNKYTGLEEIDNNQDNTSNTNGNNKSNVDAKTKLNSEYKQIASSMKAIWNRVHAHADTRYAQFNDAPDSDFNYMLVRVFGEIYKEKLEVTKSYIKLPLTSLYKNILGGPTSSHIFSPDFMIKLDINGKATYGSNLEVNRTNPNQPIILSYIVSGRDYYTRIEHTIADFGHKITELF